MEQQSNILDMSSLLQDIRRILVQSRQNVAAQVNIQLLNTYWNIGRVISEYERRQNLQAEFDAETFRALAKALTKEYGKGFSKSNLYNMRSSILLMEVSRQCLDT